MFMGLLVVVVWGDFVVVWCCGVILFGFIMDECIEVDGVDWVCYLLVDGSFFIIYGCDFVV